MRKVVVCNIMSLDGYFEGPGGNVTVAGRAQPCELRPQRFSDE